MSGDRVFTAIDRLPDASRIEAWIFEYRTDRAVDWRSYGDDFGPCRIEIYGAPPSYRMDIGDVSYNVLTALADMIMSAAAHAPRPVEMNSSTQTIALEPMPLDAPLYGGWWISGHGRQGFTPARTCAVTIALLVRLANGIYRHTRTAPPLVPAQPGAPAGPGPWHPATVQFHEKYSKKRTPAAVLEEVTPKPTDDDPDRAHVEEIKRDWRKS